jgi:hypothetical protein
MAFFFKLQNSINHNLSMVGRFGQVFVINGEGKPGVDGH